LALRRAYTDEEEAAIAAAIDRRSGTWTYLQLVEMDQQFCAALRKHHPEREITHEPMRRSA
jgi:hypothetical protein